MNRIIGAMIYIGLCATFVSILLALFWLSRVRFCI